MAICSQKTHRIYGEDHGLGMLTIRCNHSVHKDSIESLLFITQWLHKNILSLEILVTIVSVGCYMSW